MEAVLLIIAAVVLYFLPTVVAYRRDCTAFNGIFLLNLFVGWTFFGWVGSLVWAASGKTDS